MEKTTIAYYPRIECKQFYYTQPGENLLFCDQPWMHPIIWFKAGEVKIVSKFTCDYYNFRLSYNRNTLHARTWMGGEMIKIYTQPACLPCKHTTRTLDRLGIPYTKIDVTKDKKARNYIIGLGYTQLPVVVTSEGEHWSGFRDDKLRAIKICA